MTAEVSAKAASITRNPAANHRPRTFVPEIEFKGNIEKGKSLIKAGKYDEAADVIRDNGFMPDFLVADFTAFAPIDLVTKILTEFSDFLLFKLSSENLERRALKLSAMIRAMARFQNHLYFAEKVKVLAAIKSVGGSVPLVVENSFAEIETRQKRILTKDDWIACGFEVKAENPGQLVIFHPTLKQSITLYKKQVGPQSEAEKAKEREHKQGERRSRQLTRAAMFPGKVGGGGGGSKNEDGKKGKKK